MTKTRDLADLGGGFIQAGTGAMQRTVESKLQDVVSVLDFIPQSEHSAIKAGTSTYNAAPAIQAALASGGKSFYFPTGTYLIASKITLPALPGARIYGDGQSSVIKTSAVIDAIEVPSTCSGIVFENIAFIGSSVGTEGKYALGIYAPFVTVKSCYFEDFNQGVGIKLETAVNCKISLCTFKDIQGGTSGNGYGVYTIGRQTIIESNTFENVGRHDVYLSGSVPQGSQYSIVNGNISNGCGYESIAVYATSGQPAQKFCVISNNIIKGAGSIGIGLSQNVTDCVISSNTIELAVDYGIYLNGSTTANTYPKRNLISANSVVDCGVRPINLVNSIDNLTIGNVVSAVTVVPPANNGIVVSYVGSPSESPTGNFVIGTKATGGLVPVAIDNIGGALCGTEVKTTEVTWQTAANGDTSPSVKNIKNLILANTSSTSITNFDDGYDGQEITLYFDNSNTTITLANMFLAGLVPFVGTQWDTLTLVKRGIYWFEKSRSVN